MHHRVRNSTCVSRWFALRRTAAAIPVQAMAATADTGQRQAMVVGIAPRVTAAALRPMVAGVVAVPMVAVEAVVDITAVEAVVDIPAEEVAAIRVAAATPAVDTANDRDEELDVSDKLCH